MKATVFDVVAYLARRYGVERTALGDPRELRDELLDVGFEEDDVERALAWLRRLRREGRGAPVWHAAPPASHRVASEDEARKLSAGARGLLLRLERAGVLDAAAREAVYERAVGLDMPEVGTEEVRVLVALVLRAGPGPDERLVSRVLEGDLEGIYH